MNLNGKILNHLKYAKTARGMVGCKVLPTGKNINNLAWITIEMRRMYDFSGDIQREIFLAYEIEYVELNEKYREEEHVLDYDLFLVRKEHYFNIKTVEELERILRNWLDDFSVIQPIADSDHPFC